MKKPTTAELKNLIATGEGFSLEFKRTAAHLGREIWFSISFPRPKPEADAAHDAAHVVLSDVEKRIVEVAAEEAMSVPELLKVLGYHTRTGNFKKAMGHLLRLEFIEMTVPEKPTSRLQKYRLTEKGKFLQKNANKRT